MSLNPPATRDEIRDTLFFMGIPYEYEKIKTEKGNVYAFRFFGKDVLIYSPINFRYAKKKYVSAYDLKCAIINDHRHLI